MHIICVSIQNKWTFASALEGKFLHSLTHGKNISNATLSFEDHAALNT